jgi:hypothetical protein
LFNLFFCKAALKRLARILFEFIASEPPLRIEQFPDLRHKAATSAVTFGRLSYITPITPIGVETFLICNLLGLFHVSKILPKGFLKLLISLIE